MEVRFILGLQSAQVMAGLRTLLGLWILIAMVPLLDRDAVEQLGQWVSSSMNSNPYPILRWIFFQWAQPHITDILSVVVVIQALLGGALTIGFLTRITSIVLLGFTVLSGMMLAHTGWATGQLVLWLMFVCAGIMAGRSGEMYGADAIMVPASAKGGGAKPSKKASKGKGKPTPKASHSDDEDGDEGQQYHSKQQQAVVKALKQKLGKKSRRSKKQKAHSH